MSVILLLYSLLTWQHALTNTEVKYISPPHPWRNIEKKSLGGGKKGRFFPPPENFSRDRFPSSYDHQNFFGNNYAIFGPGPKIFRPPHPGHPYFRPPKFLKYAIFGLKSPFFGFCEATESPNSAPDPKIFLETLLGIFGAGRIFPGHPPLITHNSGRRNFYI